MFSLMYAWVIWLQEIECIKEDYNNMKDEYEQVGSLQCKSCFASGDAC